MGFFHGVLEAIGSALSSTKRDSSTGDNDGRSSEPLVTCTSCDDEVPESEVDEDGECVACGGRIDCHLTNDAYPNAPAR